MTPPHYKHYGNGKTYVFVEIVKREEDWEDLVVYYDLEEGPTRKACRPATEFFGMVDVSVAGMDRRQVRRYQPLTGREK